MSLKIIEKARKTIKFGKLAAGELFKQDKRLFVKIVLTDGNVYNAVELCGGKPSFFEDDDVVVRIKAELVIISEG